MARPKKARPVGVTVFHDGKTGTWHGYLSVGTRPDGRPDRRHRSAKTRAECEDKIRKLEDERDAGTLQKAGRPSSVEQWLRHWCDNIACPRVSYGTQRAYRYAIYNHLIPGVGAHRLDSLEPEHLEALYRRMLDKQRLSASTVASVHGTMRMALREAVRRGKARTNVATVAKSVAPDPADITPLSIGEARALIAACAERRNGARWSLAMLGLRQGEVLGLYWSDLDFDSGILAVGSQAQRRNWKHGCDNPAACARWKHGCHHAYRCKPVAAKCPKRKARCRTRPCPPGFVHGCADRKRCPATQARVCPARERVRCAVHRGRTCPPLCPPGCTGHAQACPQRWGGGVVVVESGPARNPRRLRTKTAAGKRRVGVPAEILAELREHRQRQVAERLRAGSMWQDHGLIFCTLFGKPIDQRVDSEEWRALLVEAGVREAKGHHARHTAATLLLAKGVDRRIVMDVMGWSSEQMLKRYQHVADEMRLDAAKQLGAALYPEIPANAPVRRVGTRGTRR